jgi:hypothetical protein
MLSQIDSTLKNPVKDLANLDLGLIRCFCLASGKAEEIFPVDPVNPVELCAL